MVWSTPALVNTGDVGQATDLNQYAALMAETAPAKLGSSAGGIVYGAGSAGSPVSVLAPPSGLTTPMLSFAGSAPTWVEAPSGGQGGGGDITAVHAGSGLTGGGVTGAVTLNVGNLPTSQITSGRFAVARLGSGTASGSTFLRGDRTWATPSSVAFDIHDDVTQEAAIVNHDRFIFSDEGVAGDPMRYATALSLKLYLDLILSLNADRITSGVMQQARLGSGPASGATFLRGDRTWATPPGDGVVSAISHVYDNGDITTTLTRTVGATLSDSDHVPHWFDSPGVPSPLLGQFGDWYIDISPVDSAYVAQVYNKTGASTWTLGFGVPAPGGGGTGSGDITAVIAGTGLDGGATSGDAILNVTDPYSAAEKSKLLGIEAGAEVNIGEEFTNTEKIKLIGIEDSADQNLTTEEFQDAVGAMAGANLAYDDVNGMLSATGGGGASFEIRNNGSAVSSSFDFVNFAANVTASVSGSGVNIVGTGGGAGGDGIPTRQQLGSATTAVAATALSLSTDIVGSNLYMLTAKGDDAQTLLEHVFFGWELLALTAVTGTSPTTVRQLLYRGSRAGRCHHFELWPDDRSAVAEYQQPALGQGLAFRFAGRHAVPHRPALWRGRGRLQLCVAVHPLDGHTGDAARQRHRVYAGRNLDGSPRLLALPAHGDGSALCVHRGPQRHE